MVSSQESPVVVWTPEMDVNLFYALMDHKPVGVNKHFHMIFIYERFNQTTETKLSVDQLWQRLSTLYDLKELVKHLFLFAPELRKTYILNGRKRNAQMYLKRN